MGTASLIAAATADPILYVIGTLLAGGGLTAIASWVKARSGAQLDVMGAAKVIFDEREHDLERARQYAHDLEVQRDALAEQNAELIQELARVNDRLDECEVRLQAREETLRGMQQRLDAITESH